jgi:hypothetical protein
MAGSNDIFEAYRRKLIGLPVSLIWQAPNSAIFLELDAAGPPDAKGRVRGRFSVMIEWSWRISSRTEIVTGSWSEEEAWASHFESLKGNIVTDVSLFGSPPELAISFSNGLQLASFMTIEGSPAWVIFDKSNSTAMKWIWSKTGEISEDGNSC